MNKRAFAVAALCLSLSAFTLAQHTKFQFDRGEDFSSFHTYMWQASPAPAKGAWNQRIIDQIDQQLQAKGLKKVDANPDLWVVYSSRVQTETSTIGGGYFFGGQWGAPSPGITSTLSERQGTLVVELADTKTKQLAWRGTATDALKDNTDKNVKIVDKAIAKLFKDYPPKQKK